MGIKLCEYGCGQEAKYQFKNGRWCCSNHWTCCPEIRKKISRSHTKEKVVDLIVENGIILCSYGCGQEAKYQFKNGRWCCSKYHSQCPEINKVKYYNDSNEICSYGCGQVAKYQFKNGKWCCSEYHSSCPEIKKLKIGSKLSEEHKKKIRETMKDTKIRETIRKANLGENNPNWKGGYAKNNIPHYDVYAHRISYAEKVRRNKDDKNILEVKCTYCGKWYISKLSFIGYRIICLNNLQRGEGRLYCSDKCKLECPIYNRTEWPNGINPQNNSREVQPELRQMRFKIDNYTCQKCNKHQDELDVALHCHHIEGIRWEPLESADLDKVITLCKDCHLEVHKIEGCGYNDMKCREEEKVK